MSTTTGKAIEANVKRATQKAAFSPFAEALMRLGFGVRGLIYFTMGLLTLDFTLGKGGAPSDPQGAIAAIGAQPAGQFLLWVVLVGLASYALWGVIRAVFDPLHKGHDLKGLITRAGFMVSAASYAFLIVPTYHTITGAGRAAQNGGSNTLSLAAIMTTPGGRWLVGLAGLAVIVVGLAQVTQGFNASFDRQFKVYLMTVNEVKLATQLGRLGTATRGFIFALTGGLIFLAAYQYKPDQPVGINATLTILLQQAYGVWLLGIVALGLIAFGIYSLLCGVWFRLKR
jgi:hypothetical protein